MHYLAPILFSVCALSVFTVASALVYETIIDIKRKRSLLKLEQQLIEKQIEAIKEQNDKLDILLSYSERIIRKIC